MSAPNEGRQSPDPERQHGRQQQDPPASSLSDLSAASNSDKAKDVSKGQLANLESNPEHPLKKYAEEKTSKKQDE